MRLGIFVLLQLCVLVAAQTSILDSAIPLQLFRGLRQWISHTFGARGPNAAKYFADAKRYKKLQDPIPEHIPFPCDLKHARSIEVPTSVDKLRPGDIDVIAAIGDSLTAGAGALSTNIIQLLIENRGVTALGGGAATWREYLTIPNIFKVFNPKLVGYAYGDSQSIEEAAQLNIAENGAFSEDLPYMVNALMKKIKKDPRIDYNNHWKLILINIGSNDLCSVFCVNPSPDSYVDTRRNNLLTALRLLRDNMPRTFVVITSQPSLRDFVARNPQIQSPVCYAMTILECTCYFALKYRNRRPQFYDIQLQVFKMEDEVVRRPEFQRDDFVVVSAPCLRNIPSAHLENGQIDDSPFAADCFHASQKGQALTANGIWNNLLEPIDRRSTGWTPLLERFLCPTEKAPYLITYKNSPK